MRTLRSIAVTVGVLRNLIKTAAPTMVGNAETSIRVPTPLALIGSGEGIAFSMATKRSLVNEMTVLARRGRSSGASRLADASVHF